MAKMKIYEIARSMQQQDKNIKSSDLVKLLNDNGFEVKGANSNIEDDAIAFLMKNFMKKKAEKPKPDKTEKPKAEPKKEAEEGTEEGSPEEDEEDEKKFPPAPSSMLFSRRAANNALLNKMAAKYGGEKPKADIQAQAQIPAADTETGRSVDALMERLNLLKR